MMPGTKKYYDVQYVPGQWRSGLRDAALITQVKQVADRHRLGALQQPYESTAAALILLLNKADVAMTKMGQEMQSMLDILEMGKREIEAASAEIVAKTNRIVELEASLKAAQEQLLALREVKHASVQSEVVPEVGSDVPRVSAPTRTRPGTKSKPTSKRNR